MEESSENIKVYVRLRPLCEGEDRSWKVEGGTTVAPLQRCQGEGYSLDSVFDEQAKTKDVYDMTTKKLIEQVVEGFNSTVFAYGQTSSGKTYTMKGDEKEPGIIPLAVRDLFQMMQQLSNERDFLVRVSYMEIYNEEIRDLLAGDGDGCGPQVAIKQSAEQGIFVDGLQETIVSSVDQVMRLVEQAEQERHVGETKMNKRSSRSHAIFRMVIESRAHAGGNTPVKVATLNLVDLAGSERISKTGAEGQRKKEGAAINKSLLSLGTVISKLSEGASHIPYRDSKLTRILQPSLGGNAKTAIVCAITPAVEHCDESHSTLRFACRAKTVVNRATMNEVMTDAALLRKQAKEIEELRKQIGTGSGMDPDAMKRKVATITGIMFTKKREADSMGEKVVREPGRRKTWCPESLDMEKPGKSRRISGSHVMFQDQIERLSIPSEPLPSDCTSQDSLHKQLEQLQSANNLMKRELDAMSALAQKKKKDLRAKEEEVRKLVQDKGSVLPALKEAEWKNRQLEKTVDRCKIDLQDALDRLSKQESRYLEMLAEKDAKLADAEERSKRAQDDSGGRELQESQKSNSAAELIEAKAEIEALCHKNERLQASQETAMQQLVERTREVERLETELKNTSQSDEKSRLHHRDMEDEIQRLNSHIADLEKRKRAPLYQKKQEEELKAALTKASEAQEQASRAEQEADIARKDLAHAKADMEKMKKDYEEQILDLRDNTFALTKKLEKAMEQASDRQDLGLQKDLDASRERAEQLERSVKEKDDLLLRLQSETDNLRCKYDSEISQLEEIQACADAASSHVRFLEERLEKEAQEAELSMQQLGAKHAEQIHALEKNAREQEDLYEKSKIEIEALISENKELKETTESLERRIGLASSSLNAADELRELKKRHREEVAKLSAQLKSAKIGSKGNEKAVERATKDSTRLKNQIKELETKLRKAIADKSSLQSDRATLEREHRTTKAQLERLSKNAEKAAALEERKRMPLVKELEETKEKLAALEGEFNASQVAFEESQQQRAQLQTRFEEEQEKHNDALSAIEGYKQDLEISNARGDDLSRSLEQQQVALGEANQQITRLENCLIDANKEIARLNEEISRQQSALRVESEKKNELQSLVETLKDGKKHLEDALAEAETNAEIVDSLRLDLQAEKAHVVTIQQNFELLEKGLEDHKNELKLSEEARTKAEATAETHKATLAEQEEYISSLEAQVNEAMAKTMEMEAIIDATKAEVKKLNSLLSQAENAIEEHDNTITEIHQEKVAMEKTLVVTEKHVEELQEQLAHHQQKIQKLEQRVQQEEASLKKSEGSMQNLMASFQEEKDGLANRVRILEGENSRLEETLRTEIEKVRKSKEEQQHKFEQEMAVSTETASSNLELIQQRHQEELQELQEKLISLQEQLTSEQAKHESAIKELRSSLEQGESAKHKIIEEKDVALQEKSNILSELQTLRDAVKHKEKAVVQHVDRIAALESQVKQLQSQIQSKPHANEEDSTAKRIQALEQKSLMLESELRKSKRREEKLQALQYRLQQDFKQASGSLEMFANLREVRSLEYELDRTANRAEKEIASLKKALKKATESSTARSGLVGKENQLP